MSRNIHHEGQDDPRFIVRLLNQPTPHDGKEGFTALMRGVYNYLRRCGGWDGEGQFGHHGLTVGTIARAIQQAVDVVHVACEKLAEAGIIVLERREAPAVTTEPESLARYAEGDHDHARLANEGDMLKSKGTTVDADLADYVRRVCEGTGLSFRDAVNWLLEQAILADQKACGVPTFSDPRPDFPQCSTCRNTRVVIVHKVTGAEAVECSACKATVEDWKGPLASGVSGRDSSTNPVIPQSR